MPGNALKTTLFLNVCDVLSCYMVDENQYRTPKTSRHPSNRFYNMSVLKP